ncbi:MAG TPA: hypothetical protein VF137_07335 [Candidatus Dormibacteraeota bacterium]
MIRRSLSRTLIGAATLWPPACIVASCARLVAHPDALPRVLLGASHSGDQTGRIAQRVPAE